MYKQRFIDIYGHLFNLDLMDEWASTYTDEMLFWQSQYFRSCAKEMFDIASASDSYSSWALADGAEVFARFLESSLVNKP